MTHIINHITYTQYCTVLSHEYGVISGSSLCGSQYSYKKAVINQSKLIEQEYQKEISLHCRKQIYPWIGWMADLAWNPATRSEYISFSIRLITDEFELKKLHIGLFDFESITDIVERNIAAAKLQEKVDVNLDRKINTKTDDLPDISYIDDEGIADDDENKEDQGLDTPIDDILVDQYLSFRDFTYINDDNEEVTQKCLIRNYQSISEWCDYVQKLYCFSNKCVAEPGPTAALFATGFTVDAGMY